MNFKKFLAVALSAAMVLGMANVVSADDITVNQDTTYGTTQVADQNLFASVDLENLDNLTITFELSASNWGWENGCLVINTNYGWSQLNWDGGSGANDITATKDDNGLYTLVIDADQEFSTGYTLAEIAEEAVGSWGQVNVGFWYVDGTVSDAVMTIKSIEVNEVAADEPTPTPTEEPTPTDEPTPTPTEEPADNTEADGNAYIAFGAADDWSVYYYSADNASVAQEEVPFTFGEEFTVTLDYANGLPYTWFIAPTIVLNEALAEGQTLECTVKTLIDGVEVAFDENANDEQIWAEETGSNAKEVTYRMMGGYNEWATQYVAESEFEGATQVQFVCTVNVVEADEAPDTASVAPIVVCSLIALVSAATIVVASKKRA